MKRRKTVAVFRIISLIRDSSQKGFFSGGYNLFFANIFVPDFGMFVGKIFEHFDTFS